MEITALPLRKKKTVKTRVAAYARVSMESENLLHSLANQVSYYTNLITSNPEWEYAGIYTDEGISGTSTKKRADFNRMMDDARAGKFDLIITKSVSRFARNTVDLLASVRELKELGIGVIFEKDHINSLDGDGELLLTLLAAFAQAESESISNNVKWKKNEIMNSGRSTVPINCFGYTWDEEKEMCIINEEQAVWVRYIYRQYLAGGSIKGITNDLRAKGVRGLRGNLFARTTVRRVLATETYVGDLILQRNITVAPGKVKPNRGEERQVLVEDAHEPIISREDFAKVQERMQARALVCDNYGYQKGELAGLIKCGKCGRAVGTVSHSKRPDYAVLECNFRKSKECDLLPVSKKEFYEIMNKTLNERDEFENAVIFDDRIDFYIKGGKVKTAERMLPINKAFVGKVFCGYCGSNIRRIRTSDKKGFCCKRRLADRNSCELKTMPESEMLEAVAYAIGRDGNFPVRIYSEIRKITVYKEKIDIELKEGTVKTWQRM